MKRISFLSAALLFAFVGCAFAHELVAKPAKFSAAKGEVVPVEIHSGHKFIVAEEVEDISRIKGGVFRNGKLHESKLKANEGKLRVDMDITAEDPSSSTIILVNKDGGVWSRTNKGGQSGTRSELEKKGLKVESSIKYDKYTKVIINSSKNDKNFGTVTGQALEIIPVTNPADAKVGEFFEIRVLLNGKPYSGEILASYDGFAIDYEETYAFAGNCNNGTAFVKITAPGLWGIRASKKDIKGVKGQYDSITARSFLIFNVK